MDRPLLRIAAGTVVAALVGAGVAAVAGAPAPAAGAPVLVELFTSQGCSSCPPADRLLSRLGSDPKWRGRVVALAYHVDYWNSLGWADPFSRAEWSRRQEEYAAASGSRRIYTPQVVVGGNEQCVGSEETEVLARIERAARQPAARVAIALRREGGELRVELDLESPPAVRRPLEVMLAVFDNGLLTAIGRGENAGRQAVDDFVVRRLERVAGLAPGAPGRASATIPIDAGWRVERLGVAAFLQDPASRVVYGAAQAMLPPP